MCGHTHMASNVSILDIVFICLYDFCTVPDTSHFSTEYSTVQRQKIVYCHSAAVLSISSIVIQCIRLIQNLQADHYSKRLRTRTCYDRQHVTCLQTLDAPLCTPHTTHGKRTIWWVCTYNYSVRDSFRICHFEYSLLVYTNN